MIARTALIFLMLASAGAAAQTPTQNERPFGAFVAPAGLPSGGMAVYGFAGAPEVGAGYRQGFGGFELEARAVLDYFLLSLGGEGYLKVPLLYDPEFEVAPYLGAGLGYRTGARYVASDNYAGWDLRLRPGAIFTLRLADTVSALGELSVPTEISLHPRGYFRTTPLVGGGAEFFLGEDVFLGLVALLGPSFYRAPLGQTQVSLGFSARVGLGFRLF
jgi:hypothetical protein